MNQPIFQTPERGGEVWRLEVCTYKNRTYANFRKWWRDDNGELRPTKMGTTFPLSALSELGKSLEVWMAETNHLPN